MLSIIVPVYNSESYLDKCIESILGQTYEKIELILVNDGSVDRSGEICDFYAQKDSRVKVIHGANCGAIGARKKGVLYASGEVITFVDSDDWIESDMYEELMKIYSAFHPDIITSGYYCGHLKDDYVIDMLDCGFYSLVDIREKVLPRMMFDGKIGRGAITPSLSNKIMKKSKVTELIEKVNEKISLGDDASLLYSVILQAESLFVTKLIKYHYIHNPNSMCNRCSLSDFSSVLLLKDEFEELFKKHQVFEIMETQLNLYIKSTVAIVVRGVYDCSISVSGGNYRFPYELIPAKSKLVLYGAGKVGQSYWLEICSGKYAQVVSWIDQNADRYFCGMKVEGINILQNKKYDFVLIAIADKEVAMQIKENLVRNDVREESIIWAEPIYVE
ncbi:MAG: glycosyltransferase [Lachnospiraceae bacterium]|nr:glycosyltransferase [Lachnospiraceae bacterium]